MKYKMTPAEYKAGLLSPIPEHLQHVEDANDQGLYDATSSSSDGRDQGAGRNPRYEAYNPEALAYCPPLGPVVCYHWQHAAKEPGVFCFLS